MASKKHKRFASLANEQCINKKELTGTMDMGLAVQKLLIEQKKNKLKKKCKTQGEQSMQKLFTDSGKGTADSKTRLRKDKQNNSQIKLTT